MMDVGFTEKQKRKNNKAVLCPLDFIKLETDERYYAYFMQIKHTLSHAELTGDSHKKLIIRLPITEGGFFWVWTRQGQGGIL